MVLTKQQHVQDCDEETGSVALADSSYGNMETQSKKNRDSLLKTIPTLIVIDGQSNFYWGTPTVRHLDMKLQRPGGYSIPRWTALSTKHQKVSAQMIVKARSTWNANPGILKPCPCTSLFEKGKYAGMKLWENFQDGRKAPRPNLFRANLQVVAKMY